MESTDIGINIRKPPKRGRLALGIASAATGGLLWGFSGACAQFLYENYDIDALFITMVRSLTAAAIFLFIILFRHREKLEAVIKSHNDIIKMLLFGIALLGSQLTYLISVAVTNAGTATVLQMSYIAFVIIYTSIATRSIPHIREISAFACAIAATWAIATQGDPATLALPAIGIVFGMMNGICEAAYVIIPKSLFDRYGSIAATGFGMIVNAIFATAIWIAVNAISGSFAIPALDSVGILVLVGGVGVIGTCMAFGLYLHGVSVVGSVTGGLLGAMEPIGAMVFTAIWLGTSFTGADWIGLLLMLAMLVIVTVPSRHKGA